MTDEEIKDLANEAGADLAGLNVESASVLAMFKRFAKSIESRTWTDTKARWYQIGREAERYDIAKMVENYCGAWDDQGQTLIQKIRERGE